MAATPGNSTAEAGDSRRRDRTRGRLALFIDLCCILTWRDIKIRYKQSVMGMLWAILMPTLIVGAGLLMRVAIAELGGNRVTTADVASLSVKALPWAFFVGGLRFATLSLTNNAQLLAKISIPRIAFPISAVLSAFIDLLTALVPLVVILALCGVTPGIPLLWVPLLLGLLLLLVTGLGMLFAIGNLFLRDVKYLVDVILTFAIFFTPVLYDVQMAGSLGPWLLLNPVAPLLEGLSAAVVHGESPQLGWIAYAAAVALGLFALGWAVFARLEGMIADYL